MSLFGDVELDLRQAAVPTGDVQINAIAPIGDIEVIVPDGVSVELTGFMTSRHAGCLGHDYPGWRSDRGSGAAFSSEGWGRMWP